MRAIRILLPTLLLAACSQPAPPAADAATGPATSPPTTTPTPRDDAPAAGLSPDAVDAGTDPAADAPRDAAATDVATPDASEAAPADGDVRQRIERLLGDAPRYEAVFTALQKGVAAHDAKAVAALALYPVSVNVGGKKRTVADAATFEREYDRIITADIAKTITEQKFDALFVNWQGVMLGNGQVWINGICPGNDCSKAKVGIVTVQD
ncbi:hypothetical protein KQ945_14515 [Bacillus subtilis subsp. subtilis]|nr:hypothetical protein [Bacillus subtilis subsp. subtilis]